MLGKLSIMFSFISSLKIYFIRRYPSNKLPLSGMAFSSALLSFIAYRACLNSRIKKLRAERLGCSKCKGGCTWM